MATYQIKLTYMRVSERDLSDVALRIKDSMTNNAHFPNPPVSMADLNLLIAEFKDIRSLAKLDGRQKGPKDQKRDQLKGTLHLIASYVVGVARNDLAILESSGFDIIKPGAKGASGNIFITTTDVEGQVISFMKPVREARMYKHQYTTDPATGEKSWQEVLTPTNKHTYNGLVTGVRYWFRVKAIRKDGSEFFSDQSSKVVQ